MKAIALLVCLALARDIAGSIFPNEYHPTMDRLMHQSLDHDHHERTTRGDHQHHGNHRNHNHRQHATSASSESKEKSKAESAESSNDYATLQTVKNWNAPLFSAIITQDDTRPTYDDMIAWKGLLTVPSDTPVEDQKVVNMMFEDAYKTMKHFTEQEKKEFHSAYVKANKLENENIHLNSTELLKKHQYEVEEHKVKTDDGYQLTIFRIAPKKTQVTDNDQEKKVKVVFLAHGLLGSSDDWLLMGPKMSLAYMLADEGYEVWLGNTRGNKYAERHVSKHVAQPDFWQFSNDEIALHDLPAMIDHALKISEQKKLHYVGVAQGTTTIFSLMAARPEYNKKIASVHAISPMVYMSKVRTPLFRMIAPNSPISERLQEQLGSGKFEPSRELIKNFGGDMCESEIGCKNVCSNAYFVITSLGDLDVELIPVMLANHPTGGSKRQMQQYGQAVASNEFRKFDYGPEINQKVYGHVQPPKYKLSNVQAPVVLYTTDMDWLSHPEDVEKLQNELPNVREHHMIKDEEFTHMDFLFSKKAPQTVYERLIENIKREETN